MLVPPIPTVSPRGGAPRSASAPLLREDQDGPLPRPMMLTPPPPAPNLSGTTSTKMKKVLPPAEEAKEDAAAAAPPVISRADGKSPRSVAVSAALPVALVVPVVEDPPGALIPQTPTGKTHKWGDLTTTTETADSPLASSRPHPVAVAPRPTPPRDTAEDEPKPLILGVTADRLLTPTTTLEGLAEPKDVAGETAKEQEEQPVSSSSSTSPFAVVTNSSGSAVAAAKAALVADIARRETLQATPPNSAAVPLPQMVKKSGGYSAAPSSLLMSSPQTKKEAAAHEMPPSATMPSSWDSSFSSADETFMKDSKAAVAAPTEAQIRSSTALSPSIAASSAPVTAVVVPSSSSAALSRPSSRTSSPLPKIPEEDSALGLSLPLCPPGVRPAPPPRPPPPLLLEGRPPKAPAGEPPVLPGPPPSVEPAAEELQENDEVGPDSKEEELDQEKKAANVYREELSLRVLEKERDFSCTVVKEENMMVHDAVSSTAASGSGDSSPTGKAAGVGTSGGWRSAPASPASSSSSSTCSSVPHSSSSGLTATALGDSGSCAADTMVPSSPRRSHSANEAPGLAGVGAVGSLAAGVVGGSLSPLGPGRHSMISPREEDNGELRDCGGGLSLDEYPSVFDLDADLCPSDFAQTGRTMMMTPFPQEDEDADEEAVFLRSFPMGSPIPQKGGRSCEKQEAHADPSSLPLARADSAPSMSDSRGLVGEEEVSLSAAVPIANNTASLLPLDHMPTAESPVPDIPMPSFLTKGLGLGGGSGGGLPTVAAVITTREGLLATEEKVGLEAGSSHDEEDFADDSGGKKSPPLDGCITPSTVVGETRPASSLLGPSRCSSRCSSDDAIQSSETSRASTPCFGNALNPTEPASIFVPPPPAAAREAFGAAPGAFGGGPSPPSPRRPHTSTPNTEKKMAVACAILEGGSSKRKPPVVPSAGNGTRFQSNRPQSAALLQQTVHVASSSSG